MQNIQRTTTGLGGMLSGEVSGRVKNRSPIDSSLHQLPRAQIIIYQRKHGSNLLGLCLTTEKNRRRDFQFVKWDKKDAFPCNGGAFGLRVIEL